MKVAYFKDPDTDHYFVRKSLVEDDMEFYQYDQYTPHGLWKDVYIGTDIVKRLVLCKESEFFLECY